MSEVWVDTDRMGTVIPQVDELDQQTKGARSGLLEGLGPLTWAAGTDDAAAKAFYASHNPTRDMVLSALDDFSKIAQGMVTGIHTMVRGYESTEENNTVPHFGGDNPPAGSGEHVKP
jgi:hypothetical protein